MPCDCLSQPYSNGVLKSCQKDCIYELNEQNHSISVRKYGKHNRCSICTDGNFVQISEIIISFHLQ